jgi:DNA-binding MarR family transcriptional regulator
MRAPASGAAAPRGAAVGCVSMSRSPEFRGRRADPAGALRFNWNKTSGSFQLKQSANLVAAETSGAYLCGSAEECYSCTRRRHLGPDSETMRKAKNHARGRDILDLGAFLPYRLSVLAQRLSRDIEEHQRRRHKLAMKDWKVMQVMAVHGELLPADIRRLGTQNKAQISRALKCLLDRGLVAKLPRPDDSRTFGVSLTEAGWAIYETMAPRMRARQEEILGGLSAGDAKELRRLLDRLEASLGDGRGTRKRPARRKR